MPFSTHIDLYMQDARNNFGAMRPAPVCLDANHAVGQCQQIHISTNCYYGYHDPKTTPSSQVLNDCEMLEVPPANEPPPPRHNARKRSASDDEYPQSKRQREEVQKEKSNEPETDEMRTDKSSEELLENLFWNTHGGNMFHLLQCS